MYKNLNDSQQVTVPTFYSRQRSLQTSNKRQTVQNAKLQHYVKDMMPYNFCCYREQLFFYTDATDADTPASDTVRSC